MNALAQIINELTGSTNEQAKQKTSALWGRVAEAEDWVDISEATYAQGWAGSVSVAMRLDDLKVIEMNEQGETTAEGQFKAAPRKTINSDGKTVIRLGIITVSSGRFTVWLNQEKQGQRHFLGLSQDKPAKKSYHGTPNFG